MGHMICKPEEDSGCGRAEEWDTGRKGKGVDRRNITFSQSLSSTGYVFAIEKYLELWPRNLLAK